MPPILCQVEKRHLLLLEVLIAFAIIALAILPLIYPQVFILKSEKEFVDTIELDHAVNLLYGNRLQKLYLNEIAWNEIEEGKSVPITETMLQESGVAKSLPFTGEYQFFIIKRKPPKPADHLYLVQLVFSFTSKKKSKTINEGGEVSDRSDKHIYRYDIFIERTPKKSEEEPGDKAQGEEKKP